MSKPALLVTLLSAIVFIAGIIALFSLSIRPGPFARGVYIDENGLLAGSSRPVPQDPEMVSQIHNLVQLCYNTNPQNQLQQISFAYCLSGIAQGLGFHANIQSEKVISLHYEAPRTSGAEGMVFVSNLHPHEYSPTISSLPIVLSSIILAHRAGYLSRDVVVYVPIPTPLAFNPYFNGNQSGLNNQTNYPTPITLATISTTPPQPPQALINFIKSNPLHSYKTWSRQYQSQLTHLLSQPTVFFSPSLPLTAVGVNILPFSINNQFSLQSLYPEGHQSNFDLASTMIHAFTTTGNKMLIQTPTLPQHELTMEMVENVLPLYSILNNYQKGIGYLGEMDIDDKNKNDNNVTMMELFNQNPITILNTKLIPIMKEIHQKCHFVIQNTIFPHFSNLFNFLKSVLLHQFRDEARGYANYIMSQYSSEPSQYLHSAFGSGGIDSITVSSIVNTDVKQYERILRQNLDNVFSASVFPQRDNDKIKAQNLSQQSELRISPSVQQTTRLPHSQHGLVQKHVSAVELWMRMLSNAHEKLHHSTWLYIIGSEKGFSSMDMYSPIFGLLWAPLPLLALFAYFTNGDGKSGQNSVKSGNGNSAANSVANSDGKGVETDDKKQESNIANYSTLVNKKSQKHQIVMEIPYVIAAIILSFILAFVPSFVTMIGKHLIFYLFFKFAQTFTPEMFSTSSSDHPPFYQFITLLSSKTNHNNENSPLQYTFINSINNVLFLFQIIATLIILSIFFKLIFNISKKLKTSGFMILFSVLMAPLALLNFSYALILLTFIIPNILLNFSPLVWYTTPNDQILTTQPTVKSKSKPILSSLISICVLIILSPIGWYILDQIISYHLTSKLQNSSHFFSLFQHNIHFGWFSSPTSDSLTLSSYFPLNNLLFFPTTQSSPTSILLQPFNSIIDITLKNPTLNPQSVLFSSLFNFFGQISGLCVQQIAYWTIYIPVFSLSLCISIQRLFGL